MADTVSKYSGTSLIASCGVAFVCGCIACYLWFCPKCPDCPTCPDCPECPTVAPIAYFDADDIALMLTPTDASGVRFYLAAAASGAMTAVAGTVKADGQHIAASSGELEFPMFTTLAGTYAEMEVLTETRAEEVTKAVATSTKSGWSIEAPSAALRNVLAVSGANGLAIVERNTTDSQWTFDLVPVTIRDGVATTLGAVPDMTVGAPCPNYCGRDMAYYLHMR